MREDADRVVGTWARWERPERSERAIAAGLPHRYRGALLLLTSDAAPENRVVATKELTSVADGEPGYRCWNTNGDLVELRESQLVAPDEAWLLKAIEDGPPRTPQAREHRRQGA